MFDFHERIESIISNGKTFTDICARYYVQPLIFSQPTALLLRQHSYSRHIPDKEKKETASKCHQLALRYSKSLKSI